MRKINVNTPIYNIKNEPMMADFGDNERTETILAEMTNYVPTSSQEVLEKFKEWQTRLKVTNRRGVKIKDYLLTVLGSKVEVQNPRENIWVRMLSVEIGQAKKEIELDEDEFQFLKRIVEKNKTKRFGIDGKIEEIEVFFPYELGQLLIALEDKPSKE